VILQILKAIEELLKVYIFNFFINCFLFALFFNLVDENDVSIRIGKEDIIYYATFVHDEINFLFLLRQVKLEKLEKDNLKLKKFLVTNREKTKKTLQLIKVAIKYSNFEGEFLVFVTGRPYRAYQSHSKYFYFYFKNFNKF
jgi:hypothetical protein